MIRKSWDDYFMEIATIVAQRSTCLRRQVGAVIVKDNYILSTGYNGVQSGLNHCEQVGCLRESLNIPSGENHELCFAVHAEQNAIIQAATHGSIISGGSIYCTHQPCFICTKMIINSKIKKIYYKDHYPDEMTEYILKSSEIELICL